MHPTIRAKRQTPTTTTATPTLLASWVLAITRMIRACQVDPMPLLKQVGIDAGTLTIPGARVPVARTNQLWCLAVEVTGNPSLGLSMPHHITNTTLYAIDTLIEAYASPRQALEAMVRLSSVASDSTVLSADMAAGRIRFSTHRETQPSWESMDAFIAVIYHRFNHLFTDRGEFFSGVDFVRQQPQDISAYEAFFSCPVSFHCEEYALHFDPERLDVALPSANPAIVSAYEGLVQDYLNGLGNSQLKMRVQRAILHLLPEHQPTRPQVAAMLAMSVRTLSRHLKDESLSFSDLLRETRCEKANLLLDQQQLSIAEIAYQLGFSDTSCFTRAYRSWMGVTPGERRNRLAEQT